MLIRKALIAGLVSAGLAASPVAFAQGGKATGNGDNGLSKGQLVALGVGGAVLVGVGIAVANDDDDPGSSSTSTSTSTSTSSATSTN